MATLFLYLQSFLSHWWPFVTAGGFWGIEAFARAYWPAAKRQLDKIPQSTHHRISNVLLLLAGFYSGFLAWSDEHEARIKAEQASLLSPYRWQLLSPSEMSALRAEFRSMVPRPIAILCGGDDCGDLSRSFRDVFKDLHWNVECCIETNSRKEDGINLWASDELSRNEAIEKIERATSGRLKIGMSTHFIFDPEKFPVQLMIGSKP